MFIVSNSHVMSCIFSSTSPAPLHNAAAGGGIPAAAAAAAAAADPYRYALDARQRELEMALHQRRHQLATQLQVEEEINCEWITAVVGIVICDGICASPSMSIVCNATDIE